MITVLFDIDGTLISTGGAGQDAMVAAMTQLYGASPEPPQVSFAGRTDRSIVSDFFQLHHVQDDDRQFQRYCETFLMVLGDVLPQRKGRVLPGVVDTLKQLAARDDVRLGLLTGNLRQAARMKLDHYGLADFFYGDGDAFGGFGDQHHSRDDVARAAIESVRSEFDVEVDASSVWVIGDTPADVQCARAIGASVLAVATGAFSRSHLTATEPDLLLDDLTDSHAWRKSLNGQSD